MFEFFEMPHFSHFQNQIGKSGAFLKIKKMLSREKIIFHMLFGASHDTPRILFWFDSRLSKLVSVPGSLLGLVFYLQREQRIVVGSDDREELTKAFFDHI